MQIYLMNFYTLNTFLGLIFLKPRVAAWRYQRGSRSLVANLMSASNQASEDGTSRSLILSREEEYDEEPPVVVKKQVLAHQN